MKQAKEIKYLRKKRIKWSSFAKDMIVYLGNAEELTKKPLKVKSEYSKVTVYKVNIQKSNVFLYTGNK